VSEDTLTSGLTTDPMLDADPAAFRVSWIKWDSSFRGAGLEIGDRIIAVDGQRFVKPKELRDLQRLAQTGIGQYAESQHWAELGAKDGTTITLTVRRRAPAGEGAVTLDIKGALWAERSYLSANHQRPTLGPGGPEEMDNDGFSGAWSAWYEAFVRRATWVLDGGWMQRSFSNRHSLEEHLEDKERVDLLVKKYPGPFANTVKADWERVQRSLAGALYQPSAEDLAYRQLGEQRAAEIAGAGRRAREAFLSAHAAERIEPFPAIDPVRGDRARVAGKLVVLPPIPTRDWIAEAGHGYLVSGDHTRGFYFVDVETAPVERMLAARERYRKLVTPNIEETFSIIGRIRPDPKMLVIDGRAATGFSVEPIAATLGEQEFVDLTVVKEQVSPFAGEDALLAPGDVQLADTATPRQVMDAFVAALKGGEERTWKSLFAPWRAENWKEEGVLYYPFYALQLDDTWVRSRRLILDKVYDARVVYVSDVRPVLTGKEFPKAPVIDEVQVELDHVGRFDGEYRSFNDITVYRVWTLQRRDGGPWRIVSVQEI